MSKVTSLSKQLRPVAQLIGLALLTYSAMSNAATYPAFGAQLESLTIDEIRLAMLEDGVTCSAIVKAHSDRIHELDGKLHSVIALNLQATQQAAAIDRLSRAEQRKLPLLCVPALVKDNIDVAGLPTTAGSKVFAKNLASKDAKAVAVLRGAGAIVVAKTNMSEFAFNYKGASAIGGRTVNPYNPRLSAGGSSSGNASALAAGFGVIALGTDTSGSIRVPSAVTGLVGLRPTLNTLSDDGVLALSPGQDVIGPMCRTAEDCNKTFTVLLEKQTEQSKSSALTFNGVRIGVVRGLFPTGPTSSTFMASVEKALELMRSQGAVIDNITLDDEQVLVGNLAPKGESAKFMSRSAFDFPKVIDAYLADRQLGLTSYAEFVSMIKKLNAEKLEGDKVLEDVTAFGENFSKRANDDRYRVNGTFRDEYVLSRLKKAMGDVSSGQGYDFLLYPSVQGFNDSALNGPNTGGTHRLSAYSGFPAISFPVGWARPSEVNGVEPVGVELLGRPGGDRRLLEAAIAWAKLVPVRATPLFGAR